VSTAARVELAFSAIGGAALALEAASALRFGEASPASLGPGTRWLDAARLLGAEPASDERRRYALLRSASGPLLLMLGSALEVRSVSMRAIYRVPALLVPAAERLACRGLVAEDGRLSFLLDPDSLATLAQRAQAARA
jgi:hypothetical protein